MSVSTDVLGLPAHASFSQVTAWSSCGRRYLLERVLRVDEQPSGALIGGSAVHESVEAILRDGLSLTDAQQHFIRNFDSAIADAGGDDAVRWAGRKDKSGRPSENREWWLAQGPLMVGRAAAMLVADADAGREVVSFEADYGFYVDGRFVKAKPDVVLRDGTTLVIRDWKTGSRKPATGPVQLAFYCHGVLAAHEGFDRVIGEVAMLRFDGEKGLYTYDPTPYLDLATRLVADFFAGTEAGVFPMNPSDLCVACGVRAHCDYGKTLNTKEEEEA